MLKDYFEVPNKPAIKSGNVLSCDFTDHETFIPQPLDFTRNTLATYVDCNGLIKVSGISDTNLVTNGDFATDANWSKGAGWTISGGAANASNATSDLYQENVIEIGKYYQVTFTISNYVGGSVRVELANNSFAGTEWSANGTYTEILLSGSTTVLFDARTSFTGSIDNVLIKEVDVNIPRIDYLTEIGKAKELQKPSLLLEPQSTNLFTYSNNFAQNSWSKQNGCSITQNQTKSPEGIVNADKLVSDNSTGEQYLLNSSVNTTIGDNVTYSCFVKKSDYDYFHLRFTSTSGVFVAASAWYNISDGTVGTVEAGITAKIENYGNGWYRCAATRTAIGTGGAKVRLQLASADNTANIVGDGIKGTFIYGAQYEIQSYCTSYIPTFKSAITRNAESCKDAGNLAVFYSEEGVLYAEISALDKGINHRYISISDGTSSNRIIIRYKSGGLNELSAFIRVGGATQFSATKIMDITKNTKVAVKYKLNDCALWINGVQEATDTSATFPSPGTINTFKFEDGSSGAVFYGRVKEAKVFRRALTDSELTELTNNIT